MITLALQLLMTSPSVYKPLLTDERMLRILTIMCPVALGLQAASLATVGQAMRRINESSGGMIQVSVRK